MTTNMRDVRLLHTRAHCMTRCRALLATVLLQTPVTWTELHLPLLPARATTKQVSAEF